MIEESLKSVVGKKLRNEKSKRNSKKKKQRTQAHRRKTREGQERKGVWRMP